METKLTILSDTHVTSVNMLPPELLADIKNADIVIHAGDFGSTEVYDSIKRMSKKFYAVRGNNDKIPLPKQLVVNINNIIVAIIHGETATSAEPEWYLKDYFIMDAPGVIIYGHTHYPKLKNILGTTIFNPGSPTANRWVEYNSYVNATIIDGKFDLKLIKV